MKRKFVLGIVLLFICSMGNAQTLDDLFRVVTFEESLKSLNIKAVENPDSITENKWIILAGALHSVTVQDRTKENYTVIIELVDGEWIDSSQVQLYRGFIEFRGAEFADVFPDRKPREPKEVYIKPNEEILIGCRYVGLANDGSPYLIGAFVKRLP